MKPANNHCDNLFCFQNCHEKKQQDLPDKRLDPQIFQKLSLKKNREEGKHIFRVQSNKKIIRPMPTTQRQNQDIFQSKVHELQHLHQIKKKLEDDLEVLDKNIDTYYSIYSKKLQELKSLKKRMNSIQGVCNSKRNILLSPKIHKNSQLNRQNESKKKLIFRQNQKTFFME